MENGREEKAPQRSTVSYFTRGNQMEPRPLQGPGNSEKEEAVPLRSIINMSAGGEARDQNRRFQKPQWSPDA
jgi:hypothetical protein